MADLPSLTPYSSSQPPPSPTPQSYLDATSMVGQSSPATGMQSGAGASVFGAIMTFLQPQQAAHPTQTPTPISTAQQQTNRTLFIVAAILILGVSVTAVYFFLKK